MILSNALPRLIGAAILLVANTASALCSIDDIKLPSDLKLNSLLPGTVHNGRWMQAWGFQSPDSTVSLAEYFYRNHEPVNRTTFNGWWQLSYMTNSCLFTLQLPPEPTQFTGDTYGRIIATFEAQGAPEIPMPSHWLPTGSVVLLDSLMKDPGKTGRVIYANTPVPTHDLVDFYTAAFVRDGLALNQQHQEQNAYSLTFEGNAQRRVVQLVPGPGISHVLIVNEAFGR